MLKKHDLSENILSALKNSDKALTYSEISKLTKISYPTMLKYMGILEANGKIEVQRLSSTYFLVKLKEVQKCSSNKQNQ